MKTFVSLENINAAYNSEDLLGEASKQNNTSGFAVDPNAKTLVLSLKDARINFETDKPHELYIPGQSYALSFSALYSKIRERTEIYFHNENLYPLFVDGIALNKFSSRKIHEGLISLLGFFTTGQNFERIEEVFSKQSKELNALEEIIENRRTGQEVDFSGLQMVQGLNPLTPVINGYELDGIYRMKYDLPSIPVPAQIQASEAEFSFLSNEYAKISDTGGKIGKFAEAILKLQNPSIHILGVDGKLNVEPKEKQMSEEKIRKKSKDDSIEAGGTGLFVGSLLGIVGSTITSIYGPGFTHQWYYFIPGGAVFGAYTCMKIAEMYNRAGLLHENEEKIKNLAVRPQGSGLLNLAFYGEVGKQTLNATEEFYDLYRIVNKK